MLCHKLHKNLFFVFTRYCVGLLVCQRDYTKTTERISTKFGGRMGHGPRKKPSILAQIQNLFFITVLNIARYSVCWHFYHFFYSRILMKLISMSVCNSPNADHDSQSALGFLSIAVRLEFWETWRRFFNQRSLKELGISIYKFMCSRQIQHSVLLFFSVCGVTVTYTLCQHGGFHCFITSCGVFFCAEHMKAKQVWHKVAHSAIDRIPGAFHTSSCQMWL